MFAFWGKNTRQGQVPWWLVGDEHNIDWVSSYLADAAKMNHYGERGYGYCPYCLRNVGGLRIGP